MRSRFPAVLSVLIGLCVAAPAFAQDVDALMRDHARTTFYAGKDLRAVVGMQIIRADGAVRRREFSMLRRNLGAGGEQQFYMFFHAPPDVRDMAFLVHKYPARDDDRWLYLPALKNVRRIAAADKRSSFVGSDFTYEDTAGRDLADEKYRLLREETVGGRPCHVVEATAANQGKRLLWIDKERLLSTKEELRDAAGQHLRTFTAVAVEQIGGRWTVTKMVMANHKTGSRTEVTLKDVAYDVGLDDGVFTERALEVPPRKWLK